MKGLLKKIAGGIRRAFEPEPVKPRRREDIERDVRRREAEHRRARHGVVREHRGGW